MIETPKLAVDVIIRRPNNHIILIQRKNPPYGWALPGGFVDVGESPRAAAIRECREETSLITNLQDIEFLGLYGEPDRDPRFHVASAVYIVYRTAGAPKAKDDAIDLREFSLDNLPELAFDHAAILNDYRAYARWGFNQ